MRIAIAGQQLIRTAFVLALSMAGVLACSSSARAGIYCPHDAGVWDYFSNGEFQFTATISCERTYEGGANGGGGRGPGREGRGDGSRPGKGGELDGSKGDYNEQQLNSGVTSCPIGNPVVIATGNKIEPELDFGTGGEMALHLKRTWNQHYDAITLFGLHWISSFDYRLSFGTRNGIGPAGSCYARPSITECSNAASHSEVWSHRADGRIVKFVRSTDGIYYENKASPISKIVPQGDGTWLLTFEDNITELYSKGGYPLWIQDEHGIRWTYTYGGLNGTQVQRVTHSSGRYVQFVWVGAELREVHDPAGNPYKFSYTQQGTAAGIHLLKTTTLPGIPATTVTYHFSSEGGEPEFGGYYYGLTGKSFNGIRYSTFNYGGSYAISTEHAGGVERHTFNYTIEAQGALSVLETNPLGKQTTYDFRNGNLMTVTGHPSASCPLAGKGNTYDANGYLDVAMDFKGNVTNYDYNEKGQLQQKVEAFGKPEARTTTYGWDVAKNRITSVTVADAVGVDLNRTDYTFTTDDRLATVTVKNLSPNVPASQNQARTTTYTYTKHPTNGLLATMVVDGPLSGDTVTSTYNVTGDLTEVRNSLGHATTYSNYNALGQPGRVTGPNGDVTEFVYDARSRLVTAKPIIGGVAQPTTYTYDSFGRLASLLTPDGRTRTREYDAAWRVTREYEPEAGGTYAVTRYTYNNASLVTSVVTERTTAIVPPAAQPTITVPALGPNGNYTVSWSAVSGTEDYVLDESPDGLTWSATNSGSALSKAYNAKPPGTYYYRVKACNAAGCTAVSNHYGVQVIYPPASAPELSAPGQSTVGSYTVSWTPVSGATSYQLEESANGGAWTLIHNAAGTSTAMSGKNAGTYSYRVKACNVVGCGPTSGNVTVQEIDPPGAPPNVFAPAVNTTGSYTVSWTTVANTTSYQLDENLNGGAWTLIYNAAGTSLALSGKGSGNFGYRVRACNAAGCGPSSSSITVQQPVYSAQYVSQSIPASIQPGQAIGVSVQMRNVGNITWTAAELYRLGSQNSADNMRWGLSRVAVPGSVAPGQIATFNFSITGPTPDAGGGGGMRAFQWQMVRDGVTWFGELTPNTGIWLDAPPPDQCGGRPNCYEN